MCMGLQFILGDKRDDFFVTKFAHKVPNSSKLSWFKKVIGKAKSHSADISMYDACHKIIQFLSNQQGLEDQRTIIYFSFLQRQFCPHFEHY